jgi:hypothetical protein
MATIKPIRSHSLAQPKPQHDKSARRRPNTYLKQDLFATLRELNRGYGIALSALNQLPQPDIFPAACVRDYRNRTESLRALANRDLLRLLAGHEDQDAARFTKSSSTKTGTNVPNNTR